MKIYIRKDDFLKVIFKNINIENENELLNELVQYYTINDEKPKISIENDIITIELSYNKIIKNEIDFKRAIQFCDNNEFEKAKPIIEKLLNKYPKISELHRIYGQILSEENEQNKAIDHLIEALRWDPKNLWALIMIGNIYSKYFNDIETAMTYYDKCIELNPNEYISINNIGANLLMSGKFLEAEKYFLTVISINPEYSNAYYGLSVVANHKNQNLDSILYLIEAIKFSKSKDQLYYQSINDLIKKCHQYIESFNSEEIILKFIKELEILSDKKIIIEEDNTLLTYAKLEIGEYHNKNYHKISYKNNKHLPHLIIHELLHLLFILKARNNNNNYIFSSNDSNIEYFLKDNKFFIEKLSKQGFDENTISSYFNQLHYGLNLQAFNTPRRLSQKGNLFLF